MAHVLLRSENETFQLVDREGAQMSLTWHREGHLQMTALRKGRRVFSMTPADGMAAAAWLLQSCNPELLTPELAAALDNAPVIVG